MPETTQLPDGEYKLAKFMGSMTEGALAVDADGSGATIPPGVVEGMSVKHMMGLGLAKEDAILIRSLIMEVPETSRLRLKEIEIKLERGEDQRLHVTQIGPYDELQGAIIANAALSRTGEKVPEIEALKHVGHEGADIIQQNAIDALKQHLPYRFRLDEEAPPLSNTSSLVHRALQSFIGGADESVKYLEFVSRKEPEDLTDTRVRNVHHIDEINVYVPSNGKLPPPLKKLVNNTNAKECKNGDSLDHYSITGEALRLVQQLAQRSGGKGYVQY